MTDLKIKIIAYTDDSQPGWVRCCFTDKEGVMHFFEEKAPAVSEKFLDEKSIYPQEGHLKCKVLDRKGNVATIDISIPFAQEDESGKSIFEVFEDRIEKGV